MGSSESSSYTLNTKDAYGIIVKGKSYMICRTGGTSANAIHTYTNNTYVYNPTGQSTYPCAITPFYYSNNITYVNPNVVLTSVIYSTTTNATSFNEIYLPMFSFDDSDSELPIKPTIIEMMGPFEWNSHKEHINIIWNRTGNIIKPKYILYYNYASGTSESVGMNGVSSYGIGLSKVVEI